jgi:hypothetical protein
LIVVVVIMTNVLLLLLSVDFCLYPPPPLPPFLSCLVAATTAAIKKNQNNWVLEMNHIRLFISKPKLSNSGGSEKRTKNCTTKIQRIFFTSPSIEAYPTDVHACSNVHALTTQERENASSGVPPLSPKQAKTLPYIMSHVLYELPYSQHSVLKIILIMHKHSTARQATVRRDTTTTTMATVRQATKLTMMTKARWATTTTTMATARRDTTTTTGYDDDNDADR